MLKMYLFIYLLIYLFNVYTLIAWQSTKRIPPSRIFIVHHNEMITDNGSLYRCKMYSIFISMYEKQG